jgi:quercetin dioxygenase-like cupin family protein
MALHHAQALEVVDVQPFGAALTTSVSTSLLKTPALQLMRVVLLAGASLPEHSVAGAITVHCLEGDAVLCAGRYRCALRAGQLVMLDGHEPHALMALTDTSLLVTVVLHPAPT